MMIVKSLLNTETTNLEDYEEFFEKYIDYKFNDFIGEYEKPYPISLLINYSEYQHEGSCTLKIHRYAKSVLSSSESIKMTFKKDKWLGESQ